MKRSIIRIDENKCDGCGLCVAGCAEGAIEVIGGKARLVSESYCDGLGACLGKCPRDAITIEEREAEAFDEHKVEAHLAARRAASHAPASSGCSCPGSSAAAFSPCSGGCPSSDAEDESFSELTHWPIQLMLANPASAHFRGRDVLLAADCSAFSLGNFHRNWLRGKALLIACPKLDDAHEAYMRKIAALIDESQIRSLTVMTMEVPCCNGLLEIALAGVRASGQAVEVRHVVVSRRGEILLEQSYDRVKESV